MSKEYELESNKWYQLGWRRGRGCGGDGGGRGGGGAKGGAIGLDDPPGLAGEGREHVVHVGARGEEEVPILSEAGEHAAGDRPPVPLAELRPLLLLLPLLPPLRHGGAAPGGHRRGEATGPALGL